MPLILAAFITGIFFLQQQADLPPLWSLATLLLIACIAAVYAYRVRTLRPRMALSSAMLCAFFIGFTYAAVFAHVQCADALDWNDEGRDVRISGVISSLPSPLERGTRFEFDVEKVESPNVHVPARLSLSWYEANVTVLPAERWSFTVRLRRPHGAFNPGGFDVELWMLERGVRATGYVRGQAQKLPTRFFPWGPHIERIRYDLRQALQQQLGERRYAGVLIALVLGDQRAISASDWALFNQTGIAHLVSISGLHITMVAGLMAAFGRALWRRSRRALKWAPAQSAAASIAVMAALAYCLLAGWGVPAQRTFFMLSVVALALMARRGLRAPSTLALAGTVVCVLDPWAVIAPGFWLSFGAVAAIMWALSGRVRSDVSKPSWRERLLDAGRVQLAVTVALIPLTIALFAQLSLVSPLANAVAIPLVSLVVTPLALLGAALLSLPAPLAALAAPVLTLAHEVFAALAQVLQFMVQWPAASLPWPAPPTWVLLCALLGVAWMLAPRGWPVRWVGALWWLPLALWPPARPATDELWVTALDVGQGTAVLVQTQTASMLFDTGPRYTPQTNAGSRIIAPYLRRQGIHALDLMVVSHLDSDHSGGAAALMKEVRVERLLTSIDPTHALIQGAQHTEPCVAEQHGALGAARWRVLHPQAEDYKRRLDTNSMSCVVMLEFGTQRVLLTGDITAAQEARILARLQEGELSNTTLLMAAHHGSHTSSSPAWAQAVQPRWVAYTMGYRNRYGHPHAAVVQRFAEIGARAVRTDESGATTWRLNAKGDVDVQRSRVEQSRYWHNRPLSRLVVDEEEVDEEEGGVGEF